MSLVTAGLLNRILDGYSLPIQGYHGLTHWARVLENGRRVASLTQGADSEILELFAVFHDARRVNEARDNGHGKRGAQLARELRDSFFALDEERFALMVYACEEHTSGLTEADVRVQVCWDADRLDLLRVNIRPRLKFLCTEAARQGEILDWANERATRRAIPGLIWEEWKFELK